jgi:hypothetical protein
MARRTKRRDGFLKTLEVHRESSRILRFSENYYLVGGMSVLASTPSGIVPQNAPQRRLGPH